MHQDPATLILLKTQRTIPIAVAALGAAVVLGFLGYRVVREEMALRKLASDSEAERRAGAAVAVELEITRALPALFEIADPSQFTYGNRGPAYVHDAIGRLLPRIPDAQLHEFVATGSRNAKLYAIARLSELENRSPEYLNLLAASLRSGDQDVVDAALWDLRRFGQSAMPILEAEVHFEDRDNVLRELGANARGTALWTGTFMGTSADPLSSAFEAGGAAVLAWVRDGVVDDPGELRAVRRFVQSLLQSTRADDLRYAERIASRLGLRQIPKDKKALIEQRLAVIESDTEPASRTIAEEISRWMRGPGQVNGLRDRLAPLTRNGEFLAEFVELGTAFRAMERGAAEPARLQELVTLAARFDRFPVQAAEAIYVRVIFALGARGDGRFLRRLLKSWSSLWLLQFDVLRAIGEEARPRLVRLLGSVAADTGATLSSREAAIVLLGAIEDSAGLHVDELVGLYRDRASEPDETSGWRASFVLSHLFRARGAGGALDLYVQLLEAGGPVRSDLFDVLARLGLEAAAAFPALIGRLRSGVDAADAADALAAIGAPAVPALLEESHSEDPNVRTWCAAILARSGDAAAPAAARLAEMLADENHVVRLSAVEALGFLAPFAREYAPQVRALESDPNEFVREYAEAASARISRRETVYSGGSWTGRIIRDPSD